MKMEEEKGPREVSSDALHTLEAVQLSLYQTAASELSSLRGSKRFAPGEIAWVESNIAGTVWDQAQTAAAGYFGGRPVNIITKALEAGLLSDPILVEKLRQRIGSIADLVVAKLLAFNYPGVVRDSVHHHYTAEDVVMFAGHSFRTARNAGVGGEMLPVSDFPTTVMVALSRIVPSIMILKPRTFYNFSGFVKDLYREGFLDDKSITLVRDEILQAFTARVLNTLTFRGHGAAITEFYSVSDVLRLRFIFTDEELEQVKAMIDDVAHSRVFEEQGSLLKRKRVVLSELDPADPEREWRAIYGPLIEGVKSEDKKEAQASVVLLRAALLEYVVSGEYDVPSFIIQQMGDLGVSPEEIESISGVAQDFLAQKVVADCIQFRLPRAEINKNFMKVAMEHLKRVKLLVDLGLLTPERGNVVSDTIGRWVLEEVYDGLDSEDFKFLDGWYEILQPYKDSPEEDVTICDRIGGVLGLDPEKIESFVQEIVGIYGRALIRYMILSHRTFDYSNLQELVYTLKVFSAFAPDKVNAAIEDAKRILFKRVQLLIQDGEYAFARYLIDDAGILLELTPEEDVSLHSLLQGNKRNNGRRGLKARIERFIK